MKKKEFEQLFIICTITVFMGQVYLTPISNWFRFSLAVVVLPLFLIFYKDIKVMRVTSVIAVSIFLFRSIIHRLTYDDLSFYEILLHYVPVISYYLIYGFLFKKFKIREKANDNDSLSIIPALWICDSTGNMIEALIRNFVGTLPLESAFFVIILIGFARSTVTYMIYMLIIQYKNRIVREQKESKFRELILLTAKLKSELFYLKKSMNDIEDTMTDSYDLYEKLDVDDLKEQALNISKNIHEIKKDYYRVVEGMEDTLSEENKPLNLTSDELFSIIRENTEKIISFNEKDILLKFEASCDFKTRDYYPLISILNNLITNSIDAIEKKGIISVNVKELDDYYKFTVYDNGIGINVEDQPLIFKPGYSTKLNKLTGKLSTGLGLAHVKGMIENYYQGSIRVDSFTYEYTKFQFEIPTSRFANKEDI